MRPRSLFRPASVFLGIVVAGAAALVAQGGNPEAQKLENPVPATAESIAAGEELYQLNCLFCHGPQGLGDGPLAPPETANLTDGEWKHGSSDGEIFTAIRKGIAPAMPPTEDRLSETEAWHLVNYVRSIGPKE